MEVGPKYELPLGKGIYAEVATWVDLGGGFCLVAENDDGTLPVSTF